VSGQSSFRNRRKGKAVTQSLGQPKVQRQVEDWMLGRRAYDHAPGEMTSHTYGIAGVNGRQQSATKADNKENRGRQIPFDVLGQGDLRGV